MTSSIAEPKWDAVVIGAGPAGAVAAFGMARAGLRTLLVDRQSFPRAKVCGGCINRSALGVLESLGLGRLPREAGGRPFSALHLKTSGGAEARLELPVGVALGRSRLDASLVDAAVGAGARFEDGWNARVVPLEGRPEFREVRLTSGEGAEARVRGRVVLAADGLGHPSLQGLAEFEAIGFARSRVGLGTVVPSRGEYPPGFIHMALGPGEYVGLVRAEGGELVIAAAVSPARLKAGGGARAVVERTLRDAGFPQPVAIGRARWLGTPLLGQRLRTAAGWRVLVLGDAAGYIEPFTGEGIAWALTGAVAAARFVPEAIAGWSDPTAREWGRRYRRLVGRHQRFCRATRLVLGSRLASEAGARLLARFPGWAAEGVRRLNAVSALSEGRG